VARIKEVAGCNLCCSLSQQLNPRWLGVLYCARPRPGPNRRAGAAATEPSSRASRLRALGAGRQRARASSLHCLWGPHSDANRCDRTPHSPDAVWRHRWGPPAGWGPEAEPQLPARGARDGTKSRRHRGRLGARGPCEAAAHDGRAARPAIIRGPRNRVRRGGTRHVRECVRPGGELCTSAWCLSAPLTTGYLGSYTVMTQLRLKQRECCGNACRWPGNEFIRACVRACICVCVQRVFVCVVCVVYVCVCCVSVCCVWVGLCICARVFVCVVCVVCVCCVCESECLFLCCIVCVCVRACVRVCVFACTCTSVLIHTRGWLQALPVGPCQCGSGPESQVSEANCDGGGQPLVPAACKPKWRVIAPSRHYRT
jgi:hypothetical protein